MFLCREKELGKLNNRYRRESFECVVIYGRRRVGKTALINEFIKDKPVVYFPALNANAQVNLEALSKSIGQYFNPGKDEYPIYSSFDAAFSAITDIAKTSGRTVFVIDEFPYLAKSDLSILSKMQHLIDLVWSETKLYLILCGSSMSFMEKEVLSEKSPLFGRRTAQFKIEPLDYLDTARFYPKLKAEDQALVFGITGGVPHYINKLSVEKSVKNALIENFFDTSSYLFEEPENLLKQELREPAVYNSVVSAIAGGASKMNEIVQKTGLESAACSKYLRVLIELGIVKKKAPFDDAKSRKSVYRVDDNFFRFWYRFVPANMISISAGTVEQIYEMSIESRLSDYMGLVFEDMCIQYLTKYCDRLPFAIESIGEWWGTDPEEKKEIQLDIVARAARDVNDKKANQYIIGSCKYTNKQVDVGELELIRRYANVFADEKDTCQFFIFSKGGFTKKLRDLEAQGEVTLVTLEDIYRR